MTPEFFRDWGDSVRPEDWPVVELEGVRWHVCPVYVAPVGIGEAVRIASEWGCELPTPELADAIYQAADLVVEPLPQTHNGTPAGMAKAYAAQEARIAQQIAGKTFTIVDGTHKNVTRDKSGRVDLYGWHTPNKSARVFRGFDVVGSIPTNPARTGSARVIQPFGTSHSPAYKDGSQGARLVRLAT